jgi:hypothetical protein
MKVTSDVGTPGYDSVTWAVKTVERAPAVHLAGQGINTCPTANSGNNTTVYALGGTAPSGPDAGSASWCPNPDYQFTAVYVTITNNGAAPRAEGRRLRRSNFHKLWNRARGAVGLT